MTDITQRAMLVSLSISQWTGRAQDPVITQEVAANHRADPTYGRYTKRLLPKGSLADVGTAATMARKFHYEQTLPWLDSGARILPTRNYIAYTEGMREHHAKFDAAVREFLEAYPRLKEEARQDDALGSLFRESDYPDADQLRLSFDFATQVMPMPSGDDFRAQIAGADAEELRQQIEARTRAAVADASRDVWNRALEAVERLKTRLDAYEVDENGHRGTKLFASLLDSVRGLVGTMDKLNIENDPEMERVRQRIENELCAFDIGDLRKDDTIRADAQRRTDDILSHLRQFAPPAPDAPAEHREAAE